jgi:Transcriptional regulator SbtR-like, C-terminal domain
MDRRGDGRAPGRTRRPAAGRQETILHAAAGQVRDDVAADELATFCLNALAAATSLPSKAVVRRLVQVTLAGLRPSAPSDGHGGR